MAVSTASPDSLRGLELLIAHADVAGSLVGHVACQSTDVVDAGKKLDV